MDIRKLNNKVVNPEVIEELIAFEEVEKAEFCGNSGLDPALTWCVFVLKDGEEVNIYSK